MDYQIEHIPSVTNHMTIDLPPLQQGSSLGVKWGGQKLSVFPVGLKDRQLPSQSVCTPHIHIINVQDAHGNVFELSQALNQTRETVCESHAAFLQLQEIQNTTQMNSIDYTHITASYRIILTNQLLKQSDTGSDNFEKLRLLVRALHFVEIFLLARESWLLPALSNYLYQHAAMDKEVLDELNQADGRVEEHESYWDTISRFVVSGSIHNAIQLLQRHSQYVAQRKATTPVGTLIALLTDLASFVTLESFTSPSDYYKSLDRWKAYLDTLDNQFTDPDMLRFLNLLKGDSELILAQTTNWEETLFAYLLFREPAMKLTGLVKDLNESTKTDDALFNAVVQGQEEEPLLFKIASRDIHGFVHELKTLGDSWALVHILDVLRAVKCWKPIQLQSGMTEHEYFFSEYSQALAEAEYPLPVIATYLEHCPTVGMQYLEQFVVRQNVTSQRQVYKLLHLCDRYQLHEAKTVITERQMKKCLEQDKIAAAIGWSPSPQVSQTLLGKLLDTVVIPVTETTEETRQKLMRIVESVGAHDLYSDVAFIKLYLVAVEAFLYTACYKAIVSNLDDMAPKRYWVYLLKDATWLLTQGVTTNASSVVALMQALQTLLSSHKKQDWIRPMLVRLGSDPLATAESKLEKEFGAMRLILAKYHASAILM